MRTRLIAVALLVLAGAACGDDDDDGTADATTAAAAATTTAAAATTTTRRAVNGLELDVTEAGDPSAPAVVLLHGFPECAYSWRH